MKLIIHDLSNEKLENLKSELEKEDKSINIIKKSIDQGSIIIDKDVWDALTVGLKHQENVKFVMDMKICQNYI